MQNKKSIIEIKINPRKERLIVLMKANTTSEVCKEILKLVDAADKHIALLLPSEFVEEVKLVRLTKEERRRKKNEPTRCGIKREHDN